MKLSIIGSGYVGLVTGACFADNGNHVFCADIATEKIEALKRSQVPFFEPRLTTLVERNQREGRLTFSDQIGEVIKKADIHFICVGTPFVDKIGTLNTANLIEVAKSVAQHAKTDDLLIIKSTVPVGTAATVREEIAKVTDTRLHLVSNPEFLKEGAAVDDFMKPDRVIIGVEDIKAKPAATMTELYKPFVRTGNPILCMDNNSAEMVKLASNGYLATRISYMNEISNLCEVTGADVRNVRQGMGLDTRIGHRYLFPGVGYGGSCFPKDIRALVHLGKDYAFGARILSAVHEVNQQQRQNLIGKVMRHFSGSVEGKTIAIWGLAFKPNTDDIRDAPSIDVISTLIDKGAIVNVYDPEAAGNIRELFADKINYFDNNYDCLKDADALCVLTEWGAFRNPDFEKIKELMRGKAIVDGRNLYNDEEMKKMGLTYYFMGQPS